jgi:GTPase
LQEERVNTFLDQANIHVQAGNGGNGSMHFRREKFVPNGGPDGGDGGNGGDVLLRTDRGLNTLFTFQRKRRFAAESGQPGGPNRMRGKSGDDLEVPVPVGTVVRDGETGELLGDLTRDGQTLLVARGGKGGLGNVHFKTSTNQAPHFAEKGEPGTSRWLDLELKLIADVGIVGLPNAGKSTLLSVISAARPKIADYPFTTLTPNLGVVEVGDNYTFVAADIPGLIEGAHEGVGLGHEFLRHIERTLVLIHLLDGSSEDPISDFHQINRELAEYAVPLTEKPQIVAINKMDLPEARERRPEIEAALQALGYSSVAISAATREGIDALIYRAAEVVREQTRGIEGAAEDEVEVITIAPPSDHFDVERRRKTFHVTGEDVERLVVMTDLENDEAVHRLQTRLKRMGVFNALQRAGAGEGSKVRIGDVEFTWDESYEPEVRPCKR